MPSGRGERVEPSVVHQLEHLLRPEVCFGSCSPGALSCSWFFVYAQRAQLRGVEVPCNEHLSEVLAMLYGLPYCFQGLVPKLVTTTSVR